MSRKSKVYPLDIRTWEGCYAWSKGHHDPAVFCAALREHWINLLEREIKHSWARVSRDGDETNLDIVSGPGRGVFPITEVEW